MRRSVATAATSGGGTYMREGSVFLRLLTPAAALMLDHKVGHQATLVLHNLVKCGSFCLPFLLGPPHACCFLVDWPKAMVQGVPRGVSWGTLGGTVHGREQISEIRARLTTRLGLAQPTGSTTTAFAAI